jgi:hypothetical protein
MADPRGDPFGVPLQAPMPRFLQNMVAVLGLQSSAEAPPAPGPGALVVAAAGVGLPPPDSAFWQRADVAEKVLLAVAGVEAERSQLAQQATESLHAERALTKEVADLKARVCCVWQ